MFGIGLPELVVVLVICFLIFGADKLTGLAKTLGQAINEFKTGMKVGESKKNETNANE